MSQSEFFFGRRVDNNSSGWGEPLSNLLPSESENIERKVQPNYSRGRHECLANLATESSNIEREAQRNVSVDLNKLMNDQRFSDVKIILKNSTWYAHKVILAARSPVFSAMFEHQMIENSTNEVNIVDIKDEIFKEVLRFIYGGVVDNIDAIVIELLEAAEKYALEELKNLCGSSLIKQLTVNEAAAFLILADRYNVQNLKSATIKFVNINAYRIIHTEGYKVLVKDHLNLIEELYRCQNDLKN